MALKDRDIGLELTVRDIEAINEKHSQEMDPLMFSALLYNNEVSEEVTYPSITKVQQYSQRVGAWLKQHLDLFFTIPLFGIVSVSLYFFILPSLSNNGKNHLLYLDWQGWVALNLLFLLLAGLISEVAPTCALFLVTLLVYILLGVCTIDEAFLGFGSDTTITVAGLYVMTLCVKDSTLLQYLTSWILGKVQSERLAILKLCIPAIIMSAILSSSSVVGLLTPTIQTWCHECGLNASYIYMPMNSIVIVAGGLTIIGSSSTLLLINLAQDAAVVAGSPILDVNFFFPFPTSSIILVGTIAFSMLTKFIIVDKSTSIDKREQDIKLFTCSVKVVKNSILAGKSLTESGLLAVPKATLISINRGRREIIAPTGSTILEEEDELVFNSSIETMRSFLFVFPGLVSSSQNQVQKLSHTYIAINAIVSINSRLNGYTPKQVKFRERYEAAIIAVHRKGDSVDPNNPSFKFQGGDSLLLVASHKFLHYHKKDDDFILVIPVDQDLLPILVDKRKPLYALLSAILISAIAITSAFRLMDLVTAVLTVDFVFIIFRTCKLKSALASINLSNIIIIGSSLGISNALTKWKVADCLAAVFLSVASPMGDLGILIGLFLITGILANFIGGSAAVSIVFPITAGIPMDNHVTRSSTLIVLMISSSANMIASWSRTTNLITMDAGGYSSKDFFYFGFPIFLIMMVCTVLIAYFFPSL